MIVIWTQTRNKTGPAQRLVWTLFSAMPLPDVMPFPTSIALEMSRRNIYGVLPPSKEDLESLDGIFTIK